MLLIFVMWYDHRNSAIYALRRGGVRPGTSEFGEFGMGAAVAVTRES